jgi:hypothetical protein
MAMPAGADERIDILRQVLTRHHYWKKKQPEQ